MKPDDIPATIIVAIQETVGRHDLDLPCSDSDDGPVCGCPRCVRLMVLAALPHLAPWIIAEIVGAMDDDDLAWTNGDSISPINEREREEARAEFRDMLIAAWSRRMEITP